MRGFSCKNHIGFSILLVLVLIYIGLFSYSSILQHNAYNTTLYDLGNFGQIVWNTAHGRFFESSVKGFNFLGDHFSPVLILITPLYRIYSDVRLLLIIQTVLLAIGVFPVYLLSKKEFGSEIIALVFSFIYLAYPALGYLNMFDFHAVSIAVPLLSFGYYFFKMKRWPLFYTCLIAAMLCKEEVSLVVAFFGIFIVISNKDIKRGTLVFSLGLLYFFFITLLVMPRIGQSQYPYFARYSHLGNNFYEIAKTVILHPIHSISISFSLRKMAGLIFLFLSLGFMPLFSSSHLIIIFPTLAYSYLSDIAVQSDIRYQYAAVIIPFMIYACLYGTKNVLNGIKKHNKKYGTVFLCILLGIVAVFSLVQVIVPLRNSPLTPRFSYNSIKEAEKLIPYNGSLTVGNSLGAHFSNRIILKEYIAEKFPDTKYVFIDLNRDFIWSKNIDSFDESVLKVIKNGQYGILYFKDGILLLERGIEKRREDEVIIYLEKYQKSNLESDNKVVSSIKRLFSI